MSESGRRSHPSYDVGVRFSSLVQVAILAFGVAVVITAAAQPSSGVPANGWTYFLLIMLGCVMYAAAHFGKRRNDGLMLLLVVGSLLLYGQSTLLLLMESESVFEFRRYGQPESAELNRALFLALQSVTALAVGLWAGRAGSIQDRRPTEPVPVLPLSFYRGRRFFLVTGAAGLLVALALTAMFSLRVSGVEGGPLAWLANLIDRDFFALLLITLLVYAGPRMQRWERQVTLAVLGLYVAVTLTQGSRGGLLVLVLSWAIVRIAREGDFRLSRRQLTAFAIAVVLTGVVIWPVATGIRLARIANLPLTPATVTRMISIARDLNSNERNVALRLVYPILHRQGRMPQAVAVANDWVPNAEDRIPARGLLLNAVAGLIPRVSVDPARFPSLARGYSIHFMGLPPDRVHGAGWSPLAVVTLFAPPGVALLIWFIWGFLTQRAYAALTRAEGGFGLVVKAAFLYLLGFQAFSSATLDALAPRFLRWVVLAAILMAIYSVLLTISQDSRQRLMEEEG